MNLFDKIPENFFSILVSKNKNIYKINENKKIQ